MEAVRTGNISITLSPFFVRLFQCHLTVLPEPLCQDWKWLVKTSGGSLWLDSFWRTRCRMLVNWESG